MEKIFAFVLTKRLKRYKVMSGGERLMEMIPIYTMSSARVNAGLSLTDAARKLGVTARTLSNYENGHSLPGMKVLDRIPNIYGISTDAIFFGDEYRLKRYEDDVKSGAVYKKLKMLISNTL